MTASRDRLTATQGVDVRQVTVSRRRLLVAQVLASVALPAGATASGILAVEIAGISYAAVPLAAIVTGSGVAALATSGLTARFGRRVGLVSAYGVATLGSGLTVLAAASSSMSMLTVASALFGAGNAAAMLTRYAAADLSPPQDRGQALSRMLFVLTIGAVLSPNLLGPAAALARALGLPPASGLFLVATAALLGTLACIPDIQNTVARDARNPPVTLPTPASSASPAFRVLRSTAIPIAILCCANLVMVTAMAVTPPLLHAHGTSVRDVGFVVSLHVAAMYAPATLVGRAVDRYGARRVATLGTWLMAGAACVGGAPGLIDAPVSAAPILVVVGIAWSVQVVAGSAWLLVESPGGSRTTAEGVGEAGMAVAAATGSSLAGPLLASGGNLSLFAVLAGISALTACTAHQFPRTRVLP